MNTTLDVPDSGRLRVIDAPPTGEPDPIWPDAPQYATERTFPRYRFVRGLNPHPFRDPEGHSYALQQPESEPLSDKNWKTNESYLRGIDLYHNGYLWEAHEAWEALWRVAEDDSLEANFLQALILNAAAQIKAHQCNPIGVKAHSQGARWRLARIRSQGYDGSESRFMGVDIASLIAQVKRHYQLVLVSTETDVVRLKGNPPRIALGG